jgi:hypothetical protein
MYVLTEDDIKNWGRDVVQWSNLGTDEAGSEAELAARSMAMFNEFVERAGGLAHVARRFFDMARDGLSAHAPWFDDSRNTWEFYERYPSVRAWTLDIIMEPGAACGPANYVEVITGLSSDQAMELAQWNGDVPDETGRLPTITEAQVHEARNKLVKVGLRQMMRALVRRYDPARYLSLAEVDGAPSWHAEAIPADQLNVEASNWEPGNEPANVLSGDGASLWHTSWDRSAPLPQSIRFSPRESAACRIDYLPRQDGCPNGNITAWTLYATGPANDDRVRIASGTWDGGAGPKSISFEPVNATWLELEVTEGVEGYASAARFELYGPAPNDESRRVLPPIEPQGTVPTYLIPMDGAGAFASSEEACNPAANVCNDDDQAIWHTPWDRSAPLPQEITILMPSRVWADRLVYRPRQDGCPNGNITRYRLWVSDPIGARWFEAASGVWDDDASEKTVVFEPRETLGVRLEALEGHEGYASAASLRLWHA